jgi:hypothetical protein
LVGAGACAARIPALILITLWQYLSSLGLLQFTFSRCIGYVSLAFQWPATYPLPLDRHHVASLAGPVYRLLSSTITQLQQVQTRSNTSVVPNVLHIHSSTTPAHCSSPVCCFLIWLPVLCCCLRAHALLAECCGMASANGAGAPPPVRDGFPVVQNEDGSISEILAISKHLVGKLIGKGGTTIQQLQATTSTSIQIDQVRQVLGCYAETAGCWGV